MKTKTVLEWKQAFLGHHSTHTHDRLLPPPPPLLPVGRIHTANIMQAFAENGSKGRGGGGGESYKTSRTETRCLGSPNYFNDHYKLKKNKGLKNLFLNANEYGNNLRSTSHFQLVTKLLSWTLQINHLYNIIYGRP